MKYFSLLVLMVMICATSGGATTDQSIASGFVSGILRYDHANANYSDFGLEWCYRRPLGESRFWLTQKSTGLTGISHGRYGNFSFQGPINLVVATVSRLVAGKEAPLTSVYGSPISIVLGLPSAHAEYELSRHFLIGLGNNTEYIFARDRRGQKGIEYRPALTFAYWAYPHSESWDAAGVRLEFGRTLFWNFEGANRAEGWTVGLVLVYGYHP